MLQACYLLQMLPVTDVSPCYRCVPLLQMWHPVTDVFPCYRCVTCHKCVTCYRYVPLLQMCFPVTDVLFSTVHKAKGLEFSTVKITDDFVDLYNTLRNRFSRYPSCRLSPWYNRTGCLGIKHQLTYLPYVTKLGMLMYDTSPIIIVMWRDCCASSRSRSQWRLMFIIRMWLFLLWHLNCWSFCIHA